MEINKQINGNEMIISLIGRLDTITSPLLEKEMNEIGEEITNVILDLEKLEYISSSGLRIVLGLQKKMNAAKGQLVIKNVCDTIKEIFEITGFSTILTIE